MKLELRISSHQKENIYSIINFFILVCSERIVQSGREIINEIFQGGNVKHVDGQTRIVGGANAQISNYPWQVSLQVRSGTSWYHICGGSIIDNGWVVTAAHCVDGTAANTLRIVAGTTNLSDLSRTVSGISNIIMHPNYGASASGYPNDIALLKLSSSLTFGTNINKVAIPTTQDFTCASCWISGWGRLTGSGSSPDTLQHVQMTVISNSECSTRWASVSGASINSGHICIFLSGKSACSGDSGGPMTCYVGNTPYLAGATSWGISTCSGAYPSVYTRLTSFRSWISTYVNI